MNNSLAKVKAYNSEDDTKISILCFISYEAALKCYRNQTISYNEVTRLIFDTKEAFHKNFPSNKIILILETRKSNYITIHKILCDESISWMYDYNIEIIK